MEYYSQYGQDKYLDENIFKGKTKGFFIDFGAHDGIVLSNSMFFEKYRQWTGICIEPIPEVYEKLKQNRKCITVNGCIGVENGTSKFLRVEGYGEMYSGLVDKYDPAHYERIQRDIKTHGGDTKEIEIKSYNLNDLLESYNVSKVDYCSIDTEGGELQILESIDFKNIDIIAFTVENQYNINLIRDYMTSVNYKLIESINYDDFFVKKRKSFWNFW